MGYPLAALAIRPAQVESPLEQFGKMMTMKSLMQQQQGQLQEQRTRQLQQQGLEQENQIREIEINDQHNLSRAYNESGGDLAKFETLARQYNVSPRGMLTLTNGLRQAREQIAKTDKEELGAMQAANAQLGAHLEEVKGVPAEDQQATYTLVRNKILRNPLLAKYAGSLPAEYPGPQALDAFERTLKTADQLLNEKRETREEEQFKQQQTEFQAKMPGGALYAPTIAKQEAQNKLSVESSPEALRLAGRKAAAEAAGRVSGEMAGFGTSALGGAPGPAGQNVSQMHGNDVLGAIQAKFGPGIAAQVKALAEGRQPFPAGFALKSPYWQNMMQLVSQYDPSFDAVNYNARSKTRNAFTSGREGQQINAINTAIGHLDQLSKAADSLNNTSLRSYNSLKNYLAKETGDPTVTNFAAIVKPVADELTRVWRGTGGAEADIKDRLAALSSSNSPEQLHQAIAQIGDLMESKLTALGSQYGQGMGTAPIQTVTPEARQTLTRLEQKVSGKSPLSGQRPAPAGATHTGRGKVDRKLHYLDANGNDLGLAE